jgi:hypothetical protein
MVDFVVRANTAAAVFARRALMCLAAATAGAILAAALPVAAQAFEVSKWEAGTCTESSCTDAGPASAFYTQAAGHPAVGLTDFEFKYKTEGFIKTWKTPEGHVKDVRVDLPPGLAVDPEAATAFCSEAELNSDEEKCPAASRVGVDQATGTAEVALGIKETVTEEFPVFDMERKAGQPARFGVEINSALLRTVGLQGHVYLEGAISWHHEEATSENSGVTTGDYHEYFVIPNIPEQPEIVESRLIFNGVVDGNAFLTLPSTCTSKPVTTLHVDSYEDPGNFIEMKNTTPVAATGCGALAFSPSLTLTPETSQSDQPDGVTADLHIPQLTSEPSKPNTADLQSAEVTLPEGMTLNPAAAHGLEACSSAQFAGGACPAGSNVGSFTVSAPGIPDGSLTGGVYVGEPEPGAAPESGGEFRIFLVGETAKYGVGLRLEGRVKANTSTGRLTAVFAGAPQVPVEELTLHFNGGARAPLANPLACGAVAPSAAITPYGGEPAKSATAHGFTVDADGAGGACPSAPPFSLAQSLTPQSPAAAGAYDPATFGLTRSPGQQYLSKITTTLPAGLLGDITSVPLCGEPNANAGTCPATSEIGTVAVAAGAGKEPYVFSGHAYLTGPYGGAPYGLSIVVPANAGPYHLGEVVTRAALSVGLYNARATVSSTLPSIVGGVPLRLQSVSVAVNRHDFLFNPTSCAALSTESLLGSTSAAADSLSSPFQVGDCGALAFKPGLSASTGGKPTKPNGASIEVKITQGAHQANIREAQLQLPPQLVARLSTLQKACPAANFEAGLPPGSCTASSLVGTATVTTPVLPGTLTGRAYFVSHGAEAFPDLDLVLQGDGVEVVLVGHTHIAKSSITTSTFENVPDVPISSVTVTLPVAANSALAANGRLCHADLLAPTTIIGQNGVKVTQTTKLSVSGCPIELLSHKRRGARMILTVWVPEAGRLSVTAKGLRRYGARAKKAGTIKLSVPLSSSTLAALDRRGAKKLKMRIAFAPKTGHNSSAASVAVR